MQHQAQTQHNTLRRVLTWLTANAFGMISPATSVTTVSQIVAYVTILSPPYAPAMSCPWRRTTLLSVLGYARSNDLALGSGGYGGERCGVDGAGGSADEDGGQELSDVPLQQLEADADKAGGARASVAGESTCRKRVRTRKGERKGWERRRESVKGNAVNSSHALSAASLSWRCHSRAAIALFFSDLLHFPRPQRPASPSKVTHRRTAWTTFATVIWWVGEKD
eukprot:2031528-Rhodomonas_salina.5